MGTVLKTLIEVKPNVNEVDNISLDMLKLCIPVILPYITHIINCCLKQGYLPDPWKKAVVVPVTKKNNPLSCNELRLIRLLPVFSKVLEKSYINKFSHFK